MEQWYSDAYFPRRQIHVIRKDVRFKLKGRRSNNRNYSLSNSHARIDFKHFLTILTAIAKKTFSNRKKRCLIQNRDFARGVCFQKHASFQAAV